MVSAPTAEVPWVQIIAVMFTIASGAVGAIVGLTKWIGKSEGKQSVASTVIQNTVAQIEELKEIVDCLRKDIQSEKIERARFEERISYVRIQLDEISKKLDRQSAERRSFEAREDDDRKSRGR